MHGTQFVLLSSASLWGQPTSPLRTVPPPGTFDGAARLSLLSSALRSTETSGLYCAMICFCRFLRLVGDLRALFGTLEVVLIMVVLTSEQSARLCAELAKMYKVLL